MIYTVFSFRRAYGLALRRYNQVPNMAKGRRENKLPVFGLALLPQFSLKILCIALATEIIFSGKWGKIKTTKSSKLFSRRPLVASVIKTEEGTDA